MTDTSKRVGLAKRILTAVAVWFLLSSGCALAPAGIYIYRQCEGEPEAVRQTNPLPIGNIVNLNTEWIKEACREEDDLLPVWLDRSLNVFCMVQAYPVSLVFDLLLCPYQLWRYHHLPPAEPPRSAEPGDKPL